MIETPLAIQREYYGRRHLPQRETKLREIGTSRGLMKCSHALRETRKRCIAQSLRYCMQKGLTAVQTNDEDAWDCMPPLSNSSSQMTCHAVYRELQAEGKVNIRVYLTAYYWEIHDQTTPKPKQGDGLLQCHRIKILSDGSLGAETAGLHRILLEYIILTTLNSTAYSLLR